MFSCICIQHWQDQHSWWTRGAGSHGKNDGFDLNVTATNNQCVYNVFLFTLCWGQIIWEVCRAGPPVPVGVHKLAVVLSLAERVSYTVKRLCGGKKKREVLVRIRIFSIVEGLLSPKISHIRRSHALPLRPSPMKILYRSELHRTTPTNFLYHVRLTYWLPLQLLWAGLYLKVKGTQIGSPPEEQRREGDTHN